MWVYENATEAGTFSGGRGRNKNLIIGSGVVGTDPFCDCQNGDIYIAVEPNSPSAATVWNSIRPGRQ